MARTPQNVDPFARPIPAGERVVRLVAWAAVAWGIGYLLWRALTTLDGAAAPAGAILLTAETLGLVVFAIRVRSSIATPITPLHVPDAPAPDVAAVVDATGASVDELRTTLVSLRRVVGLDRITVVDTGDSRWLRTIAERFGATVTEPTVTVMQATAGSSAAWVLSLRAGDLPMPDLLSICAATASAPDIGVVQFGVEEADPTSYEHDPTGRWSLDPFDHQVVRASLASRGSVPWYGDGPVLVRPGAIHASGTAELDLDTVARGVAVLAAGFRITHVPMMLARIRGPHTLSESLARRRERMAPRLRAARSARVRSLPRAERMAHLVVLGTPLAAIQRLLLVTAAVLAMGFAQLPVAAAGLDLLVFAVPTYSLRWSAQVLLGRERLGPFSVLRNDLRSIGVDTPVLSRWGKDRWQSGLALLLVLVVALASAVAVTAISVWRDWPDRLSGEVTAITLVLTAGFLGIAMEVLLDALTRRQRRVHHRVRLGLVTCRVEEIEGQLADLSTGGAGVVLACPISEAPEQGSVTTVAFRIPDADGAWRNVAALVRIAHRSPEGPNETRIGLAFDDPTDAPLDPVVEFLTIDRRLIALGRRPEPVPTPGP